MEVNKERQQATKMVSPAVFAVLPSPARAGGPETRDTYQDVLGLARRVEESGADALFLADSLAYDESFSTHTKFEPVSLAGSLLASVDRIGVIITMSTTFSHPYHVARSLTSLANIGAGRIGVNLVTSFGGEANFGLTELPKPEDRYARADEFIHVVQKLVESWGLDGLTPQPIEHVGKHFDIAGPLSIKPYSESLLVAQSGQSPEGIELAAKSAELVFNAAQFDHLQQRYFDALATTSARVRTDGMRPTVLTGLAPIIGRTTEEAWEHEQDLWGNETYETQRAKIEEVLGVDLSGIDPHDRVPRHLLPPIEEVTRRPGRASAIYEILDRYDLTLAELVRTQTRHNGHRTVVGTADHVADEIQRLAALPTLDGFIVLLPKAAELVDPVFDELLPRLRDRGVLVPADDADQTMARLTSRRQTR